MEQYKLEKLVQPLSDRLSGILLKVEIIVVILVTLFMLIKSNAADILIYFALIFLSTVYFLLAFQNLHGEKNKYDDFILKLQYYSFSIATIGFLFVIDTWKGAILMHNLGLLSIGISLFFSFILLFILKKGNPVLKTNIPRTLIIGLILTLLIFTDTYKESKKAYENQRELIQNQK